MTRRKKNIAYGTNIKTIPSYKIVKKTVTETEITITKTNCKDCPVVVRHQKTVERKRETIKVSSKDEAIRLLFGK